MLTTKGARAVLDAVLRARDLKVSQLGAGAGNPGAMSDGPIAAARGREGEVVNREITDALVKLLFRTTILNAALFEMIVVARMPRPASVTLLLSIVRLFDDQLPAGSSTRPPIVGISPRARR